MTAAARINQPVSTPLGPGLFQGHFIVHHPDGATEHCSLVKISITAETGPHRTASNCLTPRAIRSGLWVFEPNQVHVRAV